MIICKKCGAQNGDEQIECRICGCIITFGTKKNGKSVDDSEYAIIPDEVKYKSEPRAPRTEEEMEPIFNDGDEKASYVIKMPKSRRNGSAGAVPEPQNAMKDAPAGGYPFRRKCGYRARQCRGELTGISASGRF